jgi:hypothetical protein
MTEDAAPTFLRLVTDWRTWHLRGAGIAGRCDTIR